ncbi:unnamed protein product [Auanema sp. JU1783]|nr:unnamed protein product [Auanema sp. JU1783]
MSSSGNLLYPFQSVLGHMDYFNKMMLDRLRAAGTRLASGVQCRRWTWIVLLTVLVVYVFLGSTCFWVFEHNQHERYIRKWFMNLTVNRRHFARSISSHIFNDTKNLLIIIDKEQTERVQQILVESLKRYEDQVHMKSPDRTKWTFLSSFNFAYGLLLTLGHGAKTPNTIGGQIFALAYCMFGIPLFYGTACYCIYVILSPFLESTVRTVKRRLFVLYMVILMYVLWNLLLALFLYYQVFDSFWTAVFTSFLSGLTIQVPEYSQLTPCCLFVLLMACTISAFLLIMAVILFVAIQFRSELCSPSKKVPLLGDGPINDQQQKFTVIVDEAGSSKLAEE